jgi:hypothetical protein
VQLQASKLLLSWADPEKYGNRQRMEHTGKDGGPIKQVTAAEPVEFSDVMAVIEENTTIVGAVPGAPGTQVH